MPLLGLLLGLVPNVRADELACAAATTRANFSAASLQGERAFADMDRDGLELARVAATAALRCIGEPVTAEDAAAYHRLMAMVAFTAKDHAATRVEFHAARRLTPGYQIPEAVAPEGHPLLLLYTASLDADEGELQPVQSRAGWLVVDGVRGSPRPTGISVILQEFGPEGGLLRTAFLPAGEPLPEWAVPPKAVSRKTLHASLLAGTGASLAAGAVLYGLALSAHQDFWDTENPAPDDELPTLQARANTFGYTAIGFGLVGVGLGVTAGATW